MSPFCERNIRSFWRTLWQIWYFIIYIHPFPSFFLPPANAVAGRWCFYSRASVHREGVPQDHTPTPSRVDERDSMHITGMLSCFVVDFCFLLVIGVVEGGGGDRVGGWVTVSKSKNVWNTWTIHSKTLTFVSRFNNIEQRYDTGPFTWIHRGNIKWKTISVMNSCQAIDHPGLPELGHNSSICINHAVMLSCHWYLKLS